MELLLRISLLFIVSALVSGESCTLNSDCVTTTCSTGANVICEHPEDAGVEPDEGLCTCAASEPCTVRDDCFSPAHPELDCDDAQRHCYDNLCICSMFPFPGK